MHSPSISTLRRWISGAFIAAAALAPFAAVRADDPNQTPSLSEEASAEFTDLKPLIDAKNWDASLALLQRANSTADRDSYDRTVILDTTAKIRWQGKSDPGGAIAPWEEFIQIVGRHPNFADPKDLIDHYQLLAQAYYTVATDPKLKDKELKQQYLDKSRTYMKRWLASASKPSQDDLFFYASLLYEKATAAGEKIDRATLNESQEAAERGLLLATKPREQVFQLMVAIYQQESDWTRAAEYLELLAVKHPVKAYFLELMAIYNNLAVESKNADQQRSYYARAINAVERGQALGFINSPKDNYNLVSLYNQVGQFGKSVELLEGGLNSGRIDSTINNWLILAYFYQQIGADLQAVRILKKAEELFPDSGEIDRQMADIYYQMEDTANVYEYCKLAVAKGHLQAKLYTTYQLLSVVAFELGKYQEALDACDQAIAHGGSKDLLRLKQGIQDAIQREKAIKAAVENKST